MNLSCSILLDGQPFNPNYALGSVIEILMYILGLITMYLFFRRISANLTLVFPKSK